MLRMSSLREAAEFLRVLSHPCRLRIVEMLLGGEYCVGELADSCEVPSHVASEHLRLMQHCGLLDSKRDGRKTFYFVVDDYLHDLMSVVRSRYEGKNESIA